MTDGGLRTVVLLITFYDHDALATRSSQLTHVSPAAAGPPCPIPVYTHCAASLIHDIVAIYQHGQLAITVVAREHGP